MAHKLRAPPSTTTISITSVNHVSRVVYVSITETHAPVATFRTVRVFALENIKKKKKSRPIFLA